MQTSSSGWSSISIGLTAVAVLAAGQVGCDAGAAGEEIQKTTSALTAGQSACIIGSQGVRIGDRSRTQSFVAAGTLLDVGLDARLSALQQPNDVRVSGNAILRDRSTVEGNLTVSGTLTRAASASVTGTVTTGTPVTIPALLVKTVTPGSSNVTIGNDATTTLNPGNYGDVVIRSRARVTVSGTYNLRSLLVEPDVTLFQATFAGPVQINVAGAVTIGDRSVNSVVTASVTSFQIYANGNVSFGANTSFTGIVSAPLGDLTIHSRSQLTGCAGGRTVGFDPDVVQIVNDTTASPPINTCPDISVGATTTTYTCPAQSTAVDGIVAPSCGFPSSFAPNNIFTGPVVLISHVERDFAGFDISPIGNGQIQLACVYRNAAGLQIGGTSAIVTSSGCTATASSFVCAN